MSAAVKRSFASLQIYNYRLYAAGQLTSLAGNWMQIVAELWLILELTGSGTAVGIATALQFAGIMLFGILGAAIVSLTILPALTISVLEWNEGRIPSSRRTR